MIRPWIFPAVISLEAVFSFAVTDITFFAVSDSHYGQSSATKDANRAAMPGRLNTLPGKAYPAAVGGGPIAVPRGVLLPGDLIEFPDAGLWANYLADYSPTGSARVIFSVYDGLGNHDFWNYTTSQSSTLIKNNFIARNAQRTGITAFDAQNLHYSWNWDQVHFVNLNLFIGNQIGVAAQWDPNGSLTFLQNDLAQNVGSSGRPVFVFQHFNIDTVQDYYQNTQKNAMVTLLRNYNCIGILHGHSHSKKIYAFQGIDLYDDGTVMNGDIMVFHITDGRMVVVNRIGDVPGAIVQQKTITMGTPVNIPGPGGAFGRGFIFSIAGVGKIYGGNREVRGVEILSLSGRLIRKMPVSAPEMTWDRLDMRGQPAPVGLYVVRILTDAAPIQAKVLLR